jgi:hypothetical protein
MKRVSITFLLLINLQFLTAQNVLSLHPLFNEQKAVLLPFIEGVWKPVDFNIEITIQKPGDNFYILKYEDGKDSSVFEAVFVNISDHIFMDLKPILLTNIKDEEVKNALITGHRIFKVDLRNDTLQMSELSYTWCYNQSQKSKSFEDYEWIDKRLLLTMPTNKLVEYISSNIDETGMTQSFEKMVQISKQKKNVSETKSEGYVQVNYKPLPCLPSFPHQDGWFGGDGDVSVRLNDSLVLWLFSDSFVGKPEQARKTGGYTMVSNSVAISNCSGQGDIKVNYYWRNMYSNSPEPIFRSFTDRYKYWVPDAFMANNYLYVLLEKIGNKEGAAPDALFNFSLNGFTLAKVLNPFDKPSQWNIEYIPLPDFGNPYMGLRSHAVIDDYVYFFVSRNDQSQHLVRKKLNAIDNTGIPFEYFSLDKTWKTGINPQDMDTLYSGFRGTTVTYHSELKKWIMLSDIQFMDNKIKIRTAAELTGPWADEKVIYQIPETTPGTEDYDSRNFCYSPRECSANFVTNKNELLITYDINNMDFLKLTNDIKKYTPKVIKINIKKNNASR